MKKINIKFKKNNEEIINKNNINVITNNDNILCIIEKDKYIFNDNLIIKETKEEIITIDFKNKKCNIYLKNYNNNLILDITSTKIEKKDKSIQYEYKIETEKDITNIIKVEYI